MTVKCSQYHKKELHLKVKGEKRMRLSADDVARLHTTSNVTDALLVDTLKLLYVAV